MRITINGMPVEAEQGRTVLEIARENGIYIPTLCYHSKTGRAARCRACVVEVEGVRGLPTSCTLEATEGMKVVTNSPRVLQAQRMVVDLLLCSGTHECIVCEKNGNCELQDAAYHLGIDHLGFRVPDEEMPIDDSAEFIRRDYSRCIKCGRCVIACQDVVVNKVLDFGFRANEIRVVCDDDSPLGMSSCVQCGECVQLCPVGALIEKKSIGMGRPWELKTVRTTCPYCGVGCQLNLHVNGERIAKVTGVEDAEPNKGRLCIKGRFGYDFIYSEDRLTTPLIKENGEFREASWDEALDLVADRFKQIMAESGPDALGGVSCARSINEDSYQMQKLFRAVFKTNNVDHCART